MATTMSKQLAAIFAAMSDDRQRMKEAIADERLNRPAAENAIDFSHAIFVREIMAIQNDDIVRRVTDSIVKALVESIESINMLETLQNATDQAIMAMAGKEADDGC